MRAAPAAGLLLLMAGVGTGAGAGCISMPLNGWGLETAAKFVLPGCCTSAWNEADAADYDEAQQATHPTQVAAFDKHRQAALTAADLDALTADLATLKAQGRTPVAPGMSDDVITAKLDGVQVSDEVKALYRWSDGAVTCEEGQALLFHHCFLSLDEALRARAEDRQMYLGTPATWLPLMSWAGEVLYVLEEPAPVAASPVLWVSLLSPIDAVAFTNVRTMVATGMAWQQEGLWPPDALDDGQRARFEAVFRGHNPEATLVR